MLHYGELLPDDNACSLSECESLCCDEGLSDGLSERKSELP